MSNMHYTISSSRSNGNSQNEKKVMCINFKYNFPNLEFSFIAMLKTLMMGLSFISSNRIRPHFCLFHQKWLTSIENITKKTGIRNQEHIQMQKESEMRSIIKYRSRSIARQALNRHGWYLIEILMLRYILNTRIYTAAASKNGT